MIIESAEGVGHCTAWLWLLRPLWLKVLRVLTMFSQHGVLITDLRLCYIPMQCFFLSLSLHARFIAAVFAIKNWCPQAIVHCYEEMFWRLHANKLLSLYHRIQCRFALARGRTAAARECLWRSSTGILAYSQVCLCRLSPMFQDVWHAFLYSTELSCVPTICWWFELHRVGLS